MDADHDLQVIMRPRSYGEADVRIRFNLGIINEIRDKLNEDQFVIWDRTCFHKWLSAGCVSAGTKICHALFHHENPEFSPCLLSPTIEEGSQDWWRLSFLAICGTEWKQEDPTCQAGPSEPLYQEDFVGGSIFREEIVIPAGIEEDVSFMLQGDRFLGEDPQTEKEMQMVVGLKMQSADGASATTPSTSKKNVVEERTGSSNGWNIQEDQLLLEAGTKWRTLGDLGKAPEGPVTDGVNEVYHTPAGDVNTVAHDFGDLARCLDFTLIDEDEVYVPVNMCAHWYLVAFDLLHWTYTVYDSLETPNTSTFVTDYTKELVYRFSHWLWFFDFYTARGKTTEFEEFSRIYEDVPQQVGTSDCGVWLCMFLERLTSYESVKQKNEDLINDPLQYRRKMAKVFYEHRLEE
ncbi:hypothetical protein SSX86_016898 [Deinandra increscens subsp. villosa]|uniref:Ubiquitin-like protease family profile domain-containing protein n=1 Tax=Deinandra increscens subsp. villosa TaxID=3103831 RepID=A0AAP0GTS4_9ASTR